MASKASVTACWPGTETSARVGARSARARRPERARGDGVVAEAAARAPAARRPASAVVERRQPGIAGRRRRRPRIATTRSLGPASSGTSKPMPRDHVEVELGRHRHLGRGDARRRRRRRGRPASGSPSRGRRRGAARRGSSCGAPSGRLPDVGAEVARPGDQFRTRRRGQRVQGSRGCRSRRSAPEVWPMASTAGQRARRTALRRRPATAASTRVDDRRDGIPVGGRVEQGGRDRGRGSRAGRARHPRAPSAGAAAREATSRTPASASSPDGVSPGPRPTSPATAGPTDVAVSAQVASGRQVRTQREHRRPRERRRGCRRPSHRSRPPSRTAPGRVHPRAAQARQPARHECGSGRPGDRFRTRRETERQRRGGRGPGRQVRAATTSSAGQRHPAASADEHLVRPRRRPSAQDRSCAPAGVRRARTRGRRARTASEVTHGQHRPAAPTRYSAYRCAADGPSPASGSAAARPRPTSVETAAGRAGSRRRAGPWAWGRRYRGGYSDRMVIVANDRPGDAQTLPSHGETAARRQPSTWPPCPSDPADPASGPSERWSTSRPAILEREDEVHRVLVRIVLAGGALEDLVRAPSPASSGARPMVTTTDGRVLARAGADGRARAQPGPRLLRPHRPPGHRAASRSASATPTSPGSPPRHRHASSPAPRPRPARRRSRATAR